MMQFAHIVGNKQPLKVSSKPIPEAPEEGLLVKTLYSGVCHTDVHLIDDETSLGDGKVFRKRDFLGDGYKGIVPGHEIAGTILSFGSKAKPEDYDLKVGDRVIIHGFAGCGDCGMCNSGQSNICLNNTGAIHDVGLGPARPGGFATHVPIYHCRIAVKVPDSLSMEIACTLSCGALTAYEALSRAKDAFHQAYAVHGKVSCLCIGAGGLGLWGIQLSKLMYPDLKVTTTCLDIAEDKLELAKQAGADDTIMLKRGQTKEEQIKIVTKDKKRLFDVIVDFVCVPSTTDVCLSTVSKGGSYMLVGLFGGAIQLPLPPLVWQSLTIRGTRAGTPGHLRELVKNAATWKLQYPDPEFFTLENVNEALEKLEKGKISGRAVLKFE